MIDPAFIPAPLSHWDWEHKTDKTIMSLLTRGQVMAICEAYTAPITEAKQKIAAKTDAICNALLPHGLPAALPTPTPKKCDCPPNWHN